MEARVYTLTDILFSLDLTIHKAIVTVALCIKYVIKFYKI